MPERPALPTRPRRSLAAPGAMFALVAALTIWTAWRWRSGLLPAALVQDDLWVGVMVKYGTAADLPRFVAHIPMGFVAALMAAGKLVSEPTLALQLVPFVCGLALIPLTAWLTQRLTGCWELALLAAVFVAVHPSAGDYATRIKQFTWDGAVLLGLVAWGLPRVDPEERAGPWLLAAVAAAALVLSFTTVFAGAALCHLRALRSLLRRDARASGDARAAVVAALAWDAFAVVFYFLRLRSQAAEWVIGGWRIAYAFPAHAPSLAQGIDTRWLVVATQRAYGSWLGRGGWTLAALSGLGIVALLLQPRRRWQGLFFVLFFTCLPIAGLWILFPFGGGRIDFSYQSLLAALGAIGVGALARVVAAPLARIARLGRVATGLRTAVPLAVIVLCLLTLRPPPIAYGGGEPMTSEYRELVATLDAIARPDDLVILTPYAQWNVAYYTTLPVRVDLSQEGAKLFLFELVRPRSARVVMPSMALASPGNPDRVVFVAMYAGPKVMPMYEHDLQKASYERTFEKAVFRDGVKTGAVQVWTRRAAASDRAAGPGET